MVLQLALGVSLFVFLLWHLIADLCMGLLLSAPHLSTGGPSLSVIPPCPPITCGCYKGVRDKDNSAHKEGNRYQGVYFQ